MKQADSRSPGTLLFRSGLLLISSAAAIYLAFLLEPRDQMLLVQGKLGYWATAATSVFSVSALLFWARSRKFRISSLLSMTRAHGVALLLILVLVPGVLSMVPPKVRILGDEANLLGVSLAMYETRENVLWAQGVYFHGEGYKPAVYQYDKRAPGYPFLLSLSYELSGYRYQNAFLINAVAGGLALFLTYLLVQRRLGRSAGIVSIAALASFPVFWFSVS